MWSAFSASHPKLVQAVSDWFSSGHTDHRTPLQLERERWILYHPSTGVFHRWMAILPAILAQMCIGSFYSSSIFNKYMDAHVWGSPGRNAGMFTICVAFYGLGTVLLGNWVGRNGAFKSVRRTLVLTPIGWLLASVASEHHQLWLLYCGYGVLHGLGCAHAYISTTSMLQQWYPELKGFMSGLAVCGAGVGSYCWTSLGRALMDPKGQYKYEPKDVQLVFAIVFLVMLSVSLPWMRNPPPGWKPQPVTLPDSSDQSVKAKLTRWLYGGAQAAASQAGAPVPGSFTTAQSPDSVTSISQAEAPGTIHTTSRDGGDDLKVKSLPWYDPSNWKSPKYCLSPDREYTFFQAVQQQEFKLTAIMVFGQFISGAVFLSSAADMTQNIFGYDANYAALVTSWMNLVNFTGRFAWGFVTDKIGRKAFWLLSTFTQTFALALMTHAIPTQSFGLWLTCFLMIGSLYGGGFGVLPAYLSDLFGPKISAATHGVTIGIWALSCIIGIPIFTSVTSHYSASSAPAVVNVVINVITPGNGAAGFASNSTATIASATAAGTMIPTPEAYTINATWLAFLPASAFLVTLFLNVRKEDRLLRRRIGGALVRLPFGRLLWWSCRVFSPLEQSVEYGKVDAQTGTSAYGDATSGASAHAAIVVAVAGVAALESAGAYDVRPADGATGGDHVEVEATPTPLADSSPTGLIMGAAADSAQAQADEWR